ncbi:MAG: hypothetical protein NTW11_00140 [Candidatus Staskawiczbacteria bacterium]|nr:hypothetical protein [Candidatus Staskawiczbacteria bacterium]
MTTIAQVVTNALTFIVWPILTGFTVIMLCYAGILFITAQGEPEKIKTAKAAIIWVVVGLIIGIVAYSVPAIVTKVFTTTP